MKAEREAVANGERFAFDGAVKVGAVIVVVLLASCHRDDAPRGDPAAKSACDKMRAYADVPGGKEPAKCDEELARMKKKDPKRHQCMVGCVDASSSYADFRTCSNHCKRTFAPLDADEAKRIPPVALCDALKQQQSVYEQPPEAGVASCVAELTKVRDDDPQRYACIASCFNVEKADYKVTLACRDGCK